LPIGYPKTIWIIYVCTITNYNILLLLLLLNTSIVLKSRHTIVRLRYYIILCVCVCACVYLVPSLLLHISRQWSVVCPTISDDPEHNAQDARAWAHLYAKSRIYWQLPCRGTCVCVCVYILAAPGETSTLNVIIFCIKLSAWCTTA